MNKQSIREQLRTIYTDADLQTWFDPLRLSISEAGNIEVFFPHTLFAHWFTKERRKKFEREVAQVLGGHHKIIYAKHATDKNAVKHSVQKKFHTRPIATQTRAYSQWSFDSFIFNKKNEFPVAIAKEISMSPENPAHTPFIICGNAGCGKTHILRAMATNVITMLGSTAVYLGTAEELHAMATENDTAGGLKRKLTQYKAVFIDNAHEIANYVDIQQEFISLIDIFREQKKPLVMALDENFDQTAFAQKLKSRFESGLIVLVKEPDLDVRLRYARSQCAANRLHIKKELLLPLAQRLRTLPAIQGAVAKVVAYQKKNNKLVTLADIEKIMHSSAITGTSATAAAIIAHVADAFLLTEKDITGSGRRPQVVVARQIAMYLCRELLGVPYAVLGQYFSGKNHTTVLYACNKISNISKTDKNTNNLITQIRKKFICKHR